VNISSFAPVGVFMLLGVGFVLITLWIARFIRPQRPSAPKLQNYECGEPAIGTAFIQFNPRFYIFALLFVIFDVEVVFLFPWAVAYKSLGLLALIEMLIFIAILLVGLYWAWKKGVLKWV
jgi:NADH:ubiquinone oxidoreductase subunit 3 (subunit A)